jgi:hypothetical protein
MPIGVPQSSPSSSLSHAFGSPSGRSSAGWALKAQRPRQLTGACPSRHNPAASAAVERNFFTHDASPISSPQPRTPPPATAHPADPQQSGPPPAPCPAAPRNPGDPDPTGAARPSPCRRQERYGLTERPVQRQAPASVDWPRHIRLRRPRLNCWSRRQRCSSRRRPPNDERRLEEHVPWIGTIAFDPFQQ